MVPEDFIFASSGYLPQCEGIIPPKGIYSHISGIDLVQAKDKSWYILEDNLKNSIGSFLSFDCKGIVQKKLTPGTFKENNVVDNRNYHKLLKETMDYVNCGGISVIMTPGRYNAAYFEHSYLAERSVACWRCTMTYL